MIFRFDKNDAIIFHISSPLRGVRVCYNSSINLFQFHHFNTCPDSSVMSFVFRFVVFNYSHYYLGADYLKIKEMISIAGHGLAAASHTPSTFRDSPRMPTNFPQIIFSWGLLLAVIIKIHAAIEIASDEQ